MHSVFAILTSRLYVINGNSSLLTSIYNLLLTSLFVFLSFTFLHSRGKLPNVPWTPFPTNHCDRDLWRHTFKRVRCMVLDISCVFKYISVYVVLFYPVINTCCPSSIVGQRSRCPVTLAPILYFRLRRAANTGSCKFVYAATFTHFNG